FASAPFTNALTVSSDWANSSNRFRAASNSSPLPGGPCTFTSVINCCTRGVAPRVVTRNSGPLAGVEVRVGDRDRPGLPVRGHATPGDRPAAARADLSVPATIAAAGPAAAGVVRPQHQDDPAVPRADLAARPGDVEGAAAGRRALQGWRGAAR